MSDTPFIKFFPSDFLAGVAGLSPAERGVYITILAMIWDRDGPVDMDDTRLARRCGGPKATVSKIIQILIEEGKLVRTEKGISNARAEKALSDRQDRVKKAKGAAAVRWGAHGEKIQQKQYPDDAVAYAEAMQEDMPGSCYPEPEPDIGGDDSAREAKPPDPPPDKTERERLLSAMGADPISGRTGPNGRCIGRLADMQEARRWQDDLGLTFEDVLAVVTDVMARKSDGPPATFTYFTEAMRRQAGQNARPTLTPIDGGQNERNNPGPRDQHRTGASRAHDQLAAGFARAVSSITDGSG